MKTIFTLLLVTIFTTSAFAYDEGRITLSIASGRTVQVYVDNRLYEDQDNTFSINHIQAGNHTIRVYRGRGNNGQGRGNTNSRRKNNDLIYSSTIYVKPAYHVDIMINRFGKALVDEKSLNDRSGWGEEDWKDGGYGDGGYYDGGYGGSYRQPMSNSDFEQLVSKVKSQWFSSGKWNTAKDAVQANYFSTFQVRQLLQLFNSDNDKLEMAKLAYAHTVDPKNYSGLYDVFSFESSRDELERYIQNAR